MAGDIDVAHPAGPRVIDPLPMRDENGEISHKHGNTLVGTLRKIYGPGFAPSFQPHQKLSDILSILDEPSLSKLLADHRLACPC